MKPSGSIRRHVRPHQLRFTFRPYVIHRKDQRSVVPERSLRNRRCRPSGVQNGAQFRAGLSKTAIPPCRHRRPQPEASRRRLCDASLAVRPGRSQRAFRRARSTRCRPRHRPSAPVRGRQRPTPAPARHPSRRCPLRTRRCPPSGDQASADTTAVLSANQDLRQRSHRGRPRATRSRSQRVAAVEPRVGDPPAVGRESRELAKEAASRSTSVRFSPGQRFTEFQPMAADVRVGDVPAVQRRGAREGIGSLGEHPHLLLGDTARPS